jgi:hypothetical protein
MTNVDYIYTEPYTGSDPLVFLLATNQFTAVWIFLQSLLWIVVTAMLLSWCIIPYQFYKLRKRWMYMNDNYFEMDAVPSLKSKIDYLCGDEVK